MLQLARIRANKQEVIEGLNKRNINAQELIENVLNLDEQRRQNQASFDNSKAEMNRFSKEIGQLYKSGEAQKANLLKEKTTQLKESLKELEHRPGR